MRKNIAYMQFFLMRIKIIRLKEKNHSQQIEKMK